MTDRVTTSIRPLSGTLTISLSHEAWDATASAVTDTFTAPKKEHIQRETWFTLYSDLVKRVKHFVRHVDLTDFIEMREISGYAKRNSRSPPWDPLTSHQCDAHLRLREPWSSWGSCADCHTDRMCTGHQRGGWGCNIRRVLESQRSVEWRYREAFAAQLKTQPLTSCHTSMSLDLLVY